MTISRASSGERWMALSGRSGPMRIAAACQEIAEKAVASVRPITLPLLRMALGLLFVWFGVLKVAGVSPVGRLVARTLPLLPAHVVVPMLGGVEVGLGVALMTGLALRLVVLAMCLHLAGTFLTFVMVPALMFRQDNPLLLTADGEFVVKNLILISAALVLLTHASRRPSDRHLMPAAAPAV